MMKGAARPVCFPLAGPPRPRGEGAQERAARESQVHVGAQQPDLNPNRETVLYCVRGGSVSNSGSDALRAQCIEGRYVEGVLECRRRSGHTLEFRGPRDEGLRRERNSRVDSTLSSGVASVLSRRTY